MAEADDDDDARRPAFSGVSRKRGAPEPESAEDEDEDDEGEEEDADADGDDDTPASFTLTQAAGAVSTVWGLCRPFLPAHRKGLALVGLGLLVETAFNVLMPLSMKILVDDVFEGDDWATLVGMLVVLGVAGIVVSLVAIWYERVDARVGSAIVADIRERMYQHVQDLPVAFFARTRAGEVLSRFSVDMATLEDSVVRAANWGVLPLMELTAGLLLLFVLNWQLALVCLLIFPIAFIGPRFIAPRAVEASYDLKNREAAVLASVQEQLGAITVIKAFGLRRIAAGWFGTRNAAVRTAMQRSTFLSAMVERSVTIAVLLLHLFVLGLGALLAFKDVISVGTFVAFESVFWEISYNLGHLMQFAPVVIESAGAARHMQELQNEPVTIVDRPNAGALARMRSDIVFDTVSFSYAARGRQVDRLDLRIGAGRHVAIVGPSGAGKSTILGLLLRLYEPSSGRILIDGADIAGVTMETLRAQMAVVFQDNVLFHGTVRENIRLGKPEATDEEVLAAARSAEIHRFIRSLPKGYDTLVGERGATLSGGQRQRIAIARAILRDPAVLLLDEATSALDQTTEAAVTRTIREIGVGRTLIFVTHRLTSVVDMDEIIVMQRGRLVQRGTHDALIAQNGLYARLWSDQMRGRSG